MQLPVYILHICEKLSGANINFIQLISIIAADRNCLSNAFQHQRPWVFHISFNTKFAHLVLSQKKTLLKQIITPLIYISGINT